MCATENNRDDIRVIDNLTLLCKRGQQLSSIDDLDVLLDEILKTACEISSAEASSVLLFDPFNNELFFRAASGPAKEKLKKMRFESNRGIAGWVFSNCKPVVANDISSDPRHYGYVDKAVNFKTRNLICVPILWENKVIGVLEVLNKQKNLEFSEQDMEYLTILANQAGASLHITSMVDRLHNFFVNMLEILMTATETLASNQGHSVRVARLATKIAREMNVTDKEYKDIYYASLIHDIGQIKVAREQIMGGEKLLPTLGAEMIRPIKMLRRIADIVEAHHERWDGSGFPRGLKGDQIPLGARIIGLAEEYEEWKEEEAYRNQYDPYLQNDFFRRIARTHDPRVIEAFKSVRKKDRQKLTSTKSA